QKAKEGDVAAAKLLFTYSVGKPGCTADPDTLDQHEYLTTVNNHIGETYGTDRILQGAPLELMLSIFRAMLPERYESKRKLASAIMGSNEDDDKCGEGQETGAECVGRGRETRAQRGDTGAQGGGGRGQETRAQRAQRGE